MNNRNVFCADALEWLEQNALSDDCSLLASIPDISEFNHHDLVKWKSWFYETAKSVLKKTPPEGVTLFYQSDIKVNGVWVDKAYLCQKAAEAVGSELLWHKIICRVSPGMATFGRPAYSHILCFSQSLRLMDLSRSTPDVIPDLGDKTWERGMGLEACLMIAKFLKEQTNTKTLVHPFCGQGSMLAVANAFGLSAIGIERSPKRAEMAKTLNIDLDKKIFI